MEILGFAVALLVSVMLFLFYLEGQRLVHVEYNEMGRGYRMICLCPEIGYKLVEDGTVMSFARGEGYGNSPTEYLRLNVEDYPFTATDLQEMVLEKRVYRTLRDVEGLA